MSASPSLRPMFVHERCQVLLDSKSTLFFSLIITPDSQRGVHT